MDHSQLVQFGIGNPGAMVSQQVLQWAQHQGQRGTELMAHITEERGFGAIQFSQRFGSTPLFFVSGGVSHAGRDLSGD